MGLSYYEGDEVLVTSGPLAGKVGKVVKVDETTNMVTLVIVIFDRETLVDVGLHEVWPILTLWIPSWPSCSLVDRAVLRPGKCPSHVRLSALSTGGVSASVGMSGTMCRAHRTTFLP